MKNLNYLRKAEIVSEELNTVTFSAETFAEEMTNVHRTLQQVFTRVCIAWIKRCARDDYRYDERNEASHYLCSEIVTCYNLDHTHSFRISFDELYDSIPFI